jgi:hypothetical protein
MEQWPQEDIPDDGLLYIRVHKQNITKDGTIRLAAFKDQKDPNVPDDPGALSSSWQKYCETPELARAKARNPLDNGVAGAIAGEVRRVPPLTVEHKPFMVDRSHTDISGEKTIDVRVALLKAFEWCLKIGE